MTETAANPSTEPVRRLSLRARVAVLAAAAVAVAVAITSLAIFLTLRAQLYDQLDRELLARGRATVEALSENLGAVLPGDDSRIGSLSMQHGYQSSKGGTMPPVGDAEWQVAFGDKAQSLRWVYEDGEEWRVAAVPAGPACRWS